MLTKSSILRRGAYPFRRLGFKTIRFMHSPVLVFRFLGHLSHSLKDIFWGELSIAWGNMVDIMYYSGARLVIPIVSICALLSVSVSQTVFILLKPYHLYPKILPIAQNVLTHELLPLLLGLVLCIQAALHLINTRVKRDKETPEEVILRHIWPILAGMSISSLLLYTYGVVTIFIGFYLTFRFILNYSTYELMMHITSLTTFFDLVYSAIKTLILCMGVSLAAGYYYYEAAVRHLPLRKAVSRIMTRGVFWLVAISAYIKIIS